MSRKNLLVSLGRILQRLPLGWAQFIERKYLEFIKIKDNNLEKKGPIFIISCPRSGSTLCYQCLSCLDNVLPLSNVANLLYKIPLVGFYITHLFYQPAKSKFLSNSGFVNGILGEAEGDRFWRQWTGGRLDERLPKPNIRDWSHFRNVCWYFEFYHQRRVLAGYLGHALDWKTLRSDFPKCEFIVVFRNPVDVAMSILKMRRNSNALWVSTFPIECSKYDAHDEHAAVSLQVYWIFRRLSECWLDGGIPLVYEDLCAEPKRAIGDVAKRFAVLGAENCEKGLNCLPVRFSRRLNSSEQDRRDAELIESSLRALEQEFIPLHLPPSVNLNW